MQVGEDRIDTDAIRKITEEETNDNFVLLVELLNKIKTIIICAIFSAIMLAGVTGVRGYWIIHESKNDTLGSANLVVNEEAMRQYEEALKEYEQQEALYQSQLDDIRAQISAKEDSAGNSFILSTKPEDFYKEMIVYYISMDGTGVNGGSEQTQNPINSIIQAYKVLIINDAFYTYMQKKVQGNLDLDDIKKLIQLDIDADSAFLQLCVCGKSRKQADEILRLSREYLENCYDKISTAIGEYEIKVVEVLGNSGEGIRGATEAVNEAWRTHLGELNAAEEAIRERINALVKPSAPIPEVASDSKMLSAKALAKSSLKRGILGAYLGAFLAIVYIVTKYTLNDSMLDEGELRKRYGLNILSSTKRFVGRGKWKKMLAKLAGDDKRVEGVEEAALLATANINSIFQTKACGEKEVFLIGHSGNALVEVSCLMWGIVGIAGGNILVDRHAVEMLDDYDNVVIVEQKGALSYVEVGREYEKLRMLNKNVIGIIML